MTGTRIMIAAAAMAGLLALAGGCERRVISEEYRPSTGLVPEGEYQPMPRSRNGQERDWWDDLFGSDEPARRGGLQSGQTRTFTPVWNKYGNANQQPAGSNGN